MQLLQDRKINIKEKVVHMGASESQPGSFHTIPTLLDMTKHPKRHTDIRHPRATRSVVRDQLMFIIEGNKFQDKPLNKSPLLGDQKLWFIQFKSIPVWSWTNHPIFSLPAPEHIHMDMCAISGQEWKESLKGFLWNTPYHSVHDGALWYV